MGPERASAPRRGTDAKRLTVAIVRQRRLYAAFRDLHSIPDALDLDVVTAPNCCPSAVSSRRAIGRLGPVNTYLSASKMSTKWMKPMNISSSFSNRENIRR